MPILYRRDRRESTKLFWIFGFELECHQRPPKNYSTYILMILATQDKWRKCTFSILRITFLKAMRKKSYIAILVGSDAHGYWARWRVRHGRVRPWAGGEGIDQMNQWLNSEAADHARRPTEPSFGAKSCLLFHRPGQSSSIAFLCTRSLPTWVV